MTTALLILGVTVVLAVVVGVPSYVRFFAILRERHAEAYEKLGSPTIWSRSPRKSWAIHRFLFTRAYAPLADPELDHLCAFLRIFDPTLILIVLIEIAFLLKAVLRLF